MSKEIQTNTSYLSKIINHHYQKSFSSYINELRINYVLIRIREDKLFRRYSIQSMANDIGFKSKESFNSAFKKHTGILPSYFVKQIEKTAQHTQ
jgi:AraC-like DNA-binding protein